MQLIFLLVLFIVLGYLIAGSRPVQKVEESSSSLLRRSQKWLGNIFGKQPLDFRQWALGAASVNFTKDFRQWLAGLGLQEADAFESGLSNFLGDPAGDSQSFDLAQVIAGELDQNPGRMTIFVEAVTVYSREYRKAHKAQSDGKKQEKETKNSALPEPATDEKAVAQKQPSRRRSASQAAAGD